MLVTRNATTMRYALQLVTELERGWRGPLPPSRPPLAKIKLSKMHV
jgi:hypothetical protein